jgi:hypothetical protein
MFPLNLEGKMGTYGKTLAYSNGCEDKEDQAGAPNNPAMVHEAFFILLRNIVRAPLWF